MTRKEGQGGGRRTDHDFPESWVFFVTSLFCPPRDTPVHDEIAYKHSEIAHLVLHCFPSQNIFLFGPRPVPRARVNFCTNS